MPSELKAGQSKVFDVGDQKLVVEPIPLGSIKKIIKIIVEAQEKFTGNNKLTFSISTTLERYVDEFMPLLFKKSKHPFLNKEWIDDNLNVPLVQEIMEAAIAVNGLNDFFGVTVKVPVPKAVELKNGKEEDSSGSTTSADLLTVGSPGK